MIEDIKLGTKEQEKKSLSAKTVEVMDITSETYKTKEGVETRPILKFLCKHPDSEKLIEIRKIKREKDKKLEIEGLWLTKDDEGNVAKNSALGHFLRFYSVNSIKEIVGKKVDTITDDAGFLVFKGY